MRYSAQTYSPLKFLLATSIFTVLLFVFISLILVYLQPATVKNNTKTNRETISPLVPTQENTLDQPALKTYQSNFGWQVTYPTAASITTQPGSSLEKVTITSLEGEEGAENGANYSVIIRVENKSGSLSTFADRDSLKTGGGKREFFALTNIAGQNGYKTLIKAAQDYTTYYLPLKEESKVLVITTATTGTEGESGANTISEIINSLELLD